MFCFPVGRLVQRLEIAFRDVRFAPMWADSKHSGLSLSWLAALDDENARLVFVRNSFSNVFHMLLDLINLRMHLTDQIVLDLRKLFDAPCHFT